MHRLLRVTCPRTTLAHSHARTSTLWQVDATFEADNEKNDIIWDELIKADELNSYTKKMLHKMLKKIIKLKKKPWIICAEADNDIGEIAWSRAEVAGE